MRIIWFTIYNVFLLPLFIVLAYAVSLFNHKVRLGIEGRKQSMTRLAEWGSKKRNGRRVIHFHCASMGEFEQIRPVLRALSAGQENFAKVVSFFSPSGFEYVEENKDIDLKIYLPIDSLRRISRFLNLLRPDLVVISKHDVWPNFVWSLASRKVPALLVNGTMPADSYMLRPGFRNFFRTVMERLSFIAPASERDLQGFEKIVNARVEMEVLGDTRFDQVLMRSSETRLKKLLPEQPLKDKTVFVAGSIWPSDEHHLFPALLKLLKEHPRLFLILVPHEPSGEHVEQISRYFREAGWTSFRFSSGNFSTNLKKHRILIVDQIGILANLYGYGQIAYVGGSFGPGVHNVMEPAAFGLPVLFGPKILNSPEAQELVKRQAGFRVENAEDCYRHIAGLVKDAQKRTEMGRRAFQVVDENRGATEKIVRRILQYLKT